MSCICLYCKVSCYRQVYIYIRVKVRQQGAQRSEDVTHMAIMGDHTVQRPLGTFRICIMSNRHYQTMAVITEKKKAWRMQINSDWLINLCKKSWLMQSTTDLHNQTSSADSWQKLPLHRLVLLNVYSLCCASYKNTVVMPSMASHEFDPIFPQVQYYM